MQFSILFIVLIFCILIIIGIYLFPDVNTSADALVSDGVACTGTSSTATGMVTSGMLQSLRWGAWPNICFKWANVYTTSSDVFFMVMEILNLLHFVTSDSLCNFHKMISTFMLIWWHFTKYWAPLDTSYLYRYPNKTSHCFRK